MRGWRTRKPAPLSFRHPGNVLRKAAAPATLGFARFRSSDPDAVATRVPGGSFGILPLSAEPFDATLRVTDLDHGFSVRGLAADAPYVFRSVFSGNATTITVVLPCIVGDEAVMDGKVVGRDVIAFRSAGQAVHFRTLGPHEAGTLVICRDTLRDAARALLGRDEPGLLETPATMAVNRELVGELASLHVEAGRLLDDPAAHAAQSLHLLKGRILTVLVAAVAQHAIRPDHLARQLQTASMARIERAIDDTSGRPVSLQDLSLEASLPLRTIQTIVRSRTGLTALAYLQRRRIDSARAALLRRDGTVSVTSIALQSGFTHLGRFAAVYKAAYGEAPSTTLEARKQGISCSLPASGTRPRS